MRGQTLKIMSYVYDMEKNDMLAHRGEAGGVIFSMFWYVSHIIAQSLRLSPAFSMFILASYVNPRHFLLSMV